MATTPEQFFKKNMKWIVLILFVLFMVKTVQSCNRDMSITNLNKEITHLNDSLSTMFGTEKETLILELQDCKEKVVQAEHERDIYKTRAEGAERSETNMRQTLRDFKANTTITIEDKSGKDTVSIKK